MLTVRYVVAIDTTVPLDTFGFTRTQDTVYKALLRRGPATGYAIARDTSLARANVYQALDVLVARGLATTGGGRPATYRATSAGAAIALLAERAERDLAGLAGEIGAVAGKPRAQGERASGFERLDGLRALLGAASAAVDAADREILAVVGPWAPSVNEALGRARSRDVTMRVVSLGAPAPEGAALRPVPAAELNAYWGGLPMVLICDRAHAVCGVVSEGRTEGLESRSPGLVPFLRHLLRRELASAAAPRVS
jgi:sugar-specific transcriptional regulator TrmB